MRYLQFNYKSIFFFEVQISKRPCQNGCGDEKPGNHKNFLKTYSENIFTMIRDAQISKFQYFFFVKKLKNICQNDYLVLTATYAY